MTAKNLVILLTLGLLCFVLSCKKNTVATTQNSFIKVYPNAESGGYIFKHPDGGFLLFSLVNLQLQFQKLDKLGNLISTKVYPNDTFYYTLQIKEIDKAFFISTSLGTLFYKVDFEGNIIWKRKYPEASFNVTSPTFLDAQGNYYMCSTTDGKVIEDTNECSLFRFTPNGLLDTTKKWIFTTKKWKFHPINILLTRIDENNGDCYFCGNCGPDEKWGYNNEEKIYEMKLSKDSSLTMKYYDKTNTEYHNRSITQYVTTENDGLLIVANTTPKSSKLNFIQIIRTNKQMDEVWNKYYQIHHASSKANKITLLKDGNYILCGSTQGTPNTSSQPFLLKIDPNGNEIWNQIYPGVIAGEATQCLELEDGNLMIYGTTYSFGFGKNSKDAFLFKTDKEGKL